MSDATHQPTQQGDGPMDAVRGALAARSIPSGDAAVSPPSSTPLPVSVLSGFLGAGKTTGE